MKVEGVGPLIATALIAAVGDARQFHPGRELSAWLGLVPRQHSSGGHTMLLGISKRWRIRTPTCCGRCSRAMRITALRPPPESASGKNLHQGPERRTESPYRGRIYDSLSLRTLDAVITRDCGVVGRFGGTGEDHLLLVRAQDAAKVSVGK